MANSLLDSELNNVLFYYHICTSPVCHMWHLCSPFSKINLTYDSWMVELQTIGKHYFELNKTQLVAQTK